MATIDMQTMRYINLFDRVARVKTSKCFVYNNTIIFAVPASLISQAIGVGGRNIKYINLQLGKRVKVIGEPAGIRDIGRFIHDVVSPLNFRSLEIKDREVIINAGSHTKAALIGRNKVRLAELSQILEDNFGKELRII